MNRTAYHRPIGQAEPLDELRRRLPWTAPTARHPGECDCEDCEGPFPVKLVERAARDLQRGDVIVAHERIDQPVTGIRHAAGDRIVVSYDLPGIGAGACILAAGEVVTVRPSAVQSAPAH